jgi:UDP-N-acetylmuramyl pentapeptide phosphotransferase/UDP-N-acetylglucosamine-1-phosphate transferase
MLEFNLHFFIIFSSISILFVFFITNYSKLIFSGSLLDKDFLKPQAFHTEPIARIGGIAILFLLSLFILFYFLIFEIFLRDYFIISLLLFFLGFLDDIKVKINPNIRLGLMLILLVFSINIFSIEINESGLEFLDAWLENSIFQTCFVLLCFLFVINGANLIDGFNGLLSIQFLIINSIFLLINLSNQNENISIILFAQIIIVLSFLLFNFPRAKIFLGDSGSYLLGFLIAINAIKTYELNLGFSPFFYSSVLFYLFFEVFFSFIRKSLKKKSPLKPDKSHLHMLLYQFLRSSGKESSANYLTSFIINLSYFILIIPLIYFSENWVFSKYYFFSLIFVYSLVYYSLYNLKKNENI